MWREEKGTLQVGAPAGQVGPLCEPPLDPITSPRALLFFLRSQMWKASPECLEAVRSTVNACFILPLGTLVSRQRELCPSGLGVFDLPWPLAGVDPA